MVNFNFSLPIIPGQIMDPTLAKIMLCSVMDLHCSDVAHSCGGCFAGVLPVRSAIRRTQADARRRLRIGARSIKNNLNN